MLADDFVIIGERATFIVRRGQVRFTDRSTCFWPNCSPKIAKVAEVRGRIDLFFERDGTYLYLGEAMFVVHGRKHAGGNQEASLHLRSQLSRERWLELQEPLPPHHQRCPESAIAALTEDSTSADRIAALQVFVDRWFGSGQDDEPLPPMPTPLAALHRLVRANPKIMVQNALVPPDRLRDVDGRTMFYIENQHVYEWAFDADADDPAVWFRMNDHRAHWEREPETLSGFVIQLVLFEAITCAPAFGGSATCLDLAASDRLRDRFRPLPLGLWCWGPTSFHARDGALLAMMANGDDEFTAMVAAQHPDALTFITDLVDEQWESVAF